MTIDHKPVTIPADTRGVLGDTASRAGEVTARRFFLGRGMPSEVHISELELATIAATAACVAMTVPAGAGGVQSKTLRAVLELAERDLTAACVELGREQVPTSVLALRAALGS